MLNRNTIKLCVGVVIFLQRFLGEFLEYITHFSEEVDN